MKYFVITAKHHDGFAMNYSDVYPYDIRMTPFKRDPMDELSEACKKHGIPFGMYYSHAFDWEHPDAPGNDWEYTNGGGDKFLFEGEKGRWFDQHPEQVPRTARYYVDTKSIPQILELIEKYRPALLWFDTPHKLPPSENIRILKTIREADPNIVVNGRLARNHDFPSLGDYVNTGDRAAEIFPTPGYWETIPTTNESYGYSKIDRTHKPPEHFIKLLIKSAARGGTVLMNLGPTELGTIEQADLDILSGIGNWLKLNGDSIYGTTRSPLPVQTFGETTLKGNILYAHIFEPKSNSIILSGMITPINRAWLLTDSEKKPLEATRLNYFDTEIKLPELPNYTVVAIEFIGELQTGGGRLVSRTEPEYLRAFDASHIAADLSHGDGKPGRDYIEQFKNAGQTVIWQVRVHKPTLYKMSLKYTTESSKCNCSCESDASKCNGSFSVYVNGEKHTADVSPAFRTTDVISYEFETKLHGSEDIVFQMESMSCYGFQLYGISLTPMNTDLGNIVHIEEDDTDTGDFIPCTGIKTNARAELSVAANGKLGI